MRRSLPEFDNPPVIEVALGVQFEKLDTLRTPQVGYIWQEFRDRFPKTEEQPPLDPVFEQFGSIPRGRPNVRLEFLSVPPTPRLWFLNELGTELVQIQQDRFVRNWRKKDEADAYPRYKRLRESFQQDFAAFCQLVQKHQWGKVEPNQCEVTYVNLIPAGEGWREHGELENVLTVFCARYTDGELELPEEVSVNVKYVLRNDQGQPVGRLHIAANPVIRVADNCAALRLTLTARGRPGGSGCEGVLDFLDRGREAIVRGFTSITTARMHKIWKRTS